MAGAREAELSVDSALRQENSAVRRVDSALRQILGPRYPKRLPARVLVAGAGQELLTEFLESTLGSERLVVDADLCDRDLRREHRQPEGFDVILALSILGDLSDPDWVTRLRRRLDALTVEGGVLLFTSTRPPGFIGRTLDQLTGGLARWRHVPSAGLDRATPDLWLITLDPRVDWGADFELAIDQPTGCLERCALSEGGRRLELSGWAAGGRFPPRGARIELVLDGEVVAYSQTTDLRGDAVEVLGATQADEPRLGFSLSYDAPEPLDPARRIRVDVVDDLASPSNGSRHVLHAGSLEATELLLQLRHQRRIADHYRNQVELFEASRWGKLRRAWMALKARVGRTHRSAPTRDAAS